MNQTLAAPLDVRLMNATATVLFIAFACLVLWAAIAWVARSPVFAIAGIAVTGDLSHLGKSTACQCRVKALGHISHGRFGAYAPGV